MELTFAFLFIAILPSIVLAFVLSGMAERRGLSKSPWVVIGLIPVLGWLGLVLLALKPKTQQ